MGRGGGGPPLPGTSPAGGDAGGGVSGELLRRLTTGFDDLKSTRTVLKLSRKLTAGWDSMKDQHKGKSLDDLIAGNTEMSLNLLPKSNRFRRACLWVVRSKYFETFILLNILANCATLAMSTAREEFDATELGAGLVQLEFYFLAVFALEMGLKVVSMGFFVGPGTYLKDGWNVLDFIVVLLGFVQLANIGNYTSIRTVRVLRPLRTITRVAGMKALVVTMLGSIPQLMDVLALCAFIFLVFGIIAVQLFAGVLRNRCAVPVFDNASTLADAAGTLIWSGVTYNVPDALAGQVCSGPLAKETVWVDPTGNGDRRMRAGELGGGWGCDIDPSAAYPDGTVCADYGNPFNGLVSFDNILWSWLTIFQVITMSSWPYFMYDTMAAVSPWVWLYFFAIVIVGGFFAVNLALAVLFMQFTANSNKAGKEEEAEEEEALSEGFYEEIEGSGDVKAAAAAALPSISS